MSCMNNSVYAQRSELPIAWTCKTYALAYGFLGLSDKPSRPLLRHFRSVLLRVGFAIRVVASGVRRAGELRRVRADISCEII